MTTALTLAPDNARLAPIAEPAAVARMVRYRRTGSSPGMPRWYVDDWRRRMAPRRYVEPAYTPARYLTRISNETHRAWIFAQFAPPAGVSLARYVQAWNTLHHYREAA